MVGILSDIDEINEIMDITEVFVVEQRMMDLAYQVDSKKIIKKTYLEPTKKSNIHQNKTNGRLQFLTVRGLN